jgi:hypothetical protein
VVDLPPFLLPPLPLDDLGLLEDLPISLSLSLYLSIYIYLSACIYKFKDNNMFMGMEDERQ